MHLKAFFFFFFSPTLNKNAQNQWNNNLIKKWLTFLPRPAYCNAHYKIVYRHQPNLPKMVQKWAYKFKKFHFLSGYLSRNGNFWHILKSKNRNREKTRKSSNMWTNSKHKFLISFTTNYKNNCSPKNLILSVLRTVRYPLLRIWILNSDDFQLDPPTVFVNFLTEGIYSSGPSILFAFTTSFRPAPASAVVQQLATAEVKSL